MERTWDAIVVGGGPSGTVAALSLGRAGHRVLLVDRARFPRDKVCGDLQGRRATTVLSQLGLMDQALELPLYEVRHHVFSAPDGTQFTLHERERPPDAPPASWICRRLHFDEMLMKAARAEVEVREGFAVTGLLRDSERVTGVVGCEEGGEPLELTAKIVIGADGTAGVVARELGASKPPPEHLCVAVRGYWRGISGLTRATETHFLRELLPGYLWVFALSGDVANVGLGILVPALKDLGAPPRELLETLLASNPLLAPRFAHAEPVGEVEAWSIPFGTHRRKLAWSGALLVGDAACLVDPFTGEGVGNGMWSGRVAADVADRALRTGSVTEAALQGYPDRVAAELGPTIARSAFLQRLVPREKLLNRVAKKAVRSERLREHFTRMIEDEGARARLRSPLFYLEVLLA